MIGQCTTPEFKGSSEEIDDVPAGTGVVWRVCTQEDEQCTTSDCEDFSAETDETGEKIAEK